MMATPSFPSDDAARSALNQTSPNIPDPATFKLNIGSILKQDVSVADRVTQANAYAAATGSALDQAALLKGAQSGSASFLDNQNVPTGVLSTADPVVGDEIVVTAHSTRADHRIRISAFSRTNSEIKEQIYGVRDKTSNILAPLWETDGLLFPYTPSIQVSQDTSWQTADLEGTNYDILSFQKSSSATISLTGKFTVQNQREGQYLLAAIHFLRTVSKSYFGAQHAENFAPTKSETPGSISSTTADENATNSQKEDTQSGRAGLPPPVLLFSGYGDYMFNDIRVVVKSHSWAYDENADLIKISLDTKGTVWLPPLMTLNVTLAMQANTDQLRERFNLDEFRTGALLKKGGWF